MSILQQAWKDSIKNKVGVSVKRSRLMGDRVWAVETYNGLWLDAFKTKKAALQFCKKYQLPIWVEEMKRNRH